MISGTRDEVTAWRIQTKIIAYRRRPSDFSVGLELSCHPGQFILGTINNHGPIISMIHFYRRD